MVAVSDWACVWVWHTMIFDPILIQQSKRCQQNHWTFSLWTKKIEWTILTWNLLTYWPAKIPLTFRIEDGWSKILDDIRKEIHKLKTSRGQKWVTWGRLLKEWCAHWSTWSIMFWGWSMGLGMQGHQQQQKHKWTWRTSHWVSRSLTSKSLHAIFRLPCVGWAAIVFRSCSGVNQTIQYHHGI